MRAASHSIAQKEGPGGQSWRHFQRGARPESLNPWEAHHTVDTDVQVRRAPLHMKLTLSSLRCHVLLAADAMLICCLQWHAWLAALFVLMLPPLISQ